MLKYGVANETNNIGKLFSTDDRPAYYHTYGKNGGTWNIAEISPIIKYARKNNLEVRAWHLNMSGFTLITVKDYDTTEESGYKLYESIMVWLVNLSLILGVYHYI